jgi:hypothetical protein
MGRNLTKTFSLLPPLVHCYIRESIRLSILLTEDMSKSHIPSPIRDMLVDREPDFLEFDIFDLVVARELLDHELTISTKFDLCGTEFDRTGDTEESGSIFCDIVGGDTDILEPLLDAVPICIHDKNPAPRRSRIPTRTTIRIDYQFTFLFCHTPKEYLFFYLRREILVPRMTKTIQVLPTSGTVV